MLDVLYDIFLIALIPIALYGFYSKIKDKTDMYSNEKPNGKIIILHGPLSSDKALIQDAIASMMLPKIWIKLGIDISLSQIFPKGFDHLSENELDKIVYGINSSMLAYAYEGNNVIIDYTPYKEDWIIDLLGKASEGKHCIVKVNVPLDNLKKEGTNNFLSTGYNDLEVDLNIISPEEAAEKIKKIIIKK